MIQNDVVGNDPTCVVDARRVHAGKIQIRGDSGVVYEHADVRVPQA
jgi:hypothetical protein